MAAYEHEHLLRTILASEGRNSGKWSTYEMVGHGQGAQEGLDE